MQQLKSLIMFKVKAVWGDDFVFKHLARVMTAMI